MFRKTFVRAVVITAVAFITSLMPVAPVAAGDSGSKAAEMSIISVQGSSTLNVKPDLAEITLGVDAEGQTARVAQEKAAINMDATIKALTGQGIKDEDIKTTRFSISPIYGTDKKTGASIVQGYRAQNRVIAKTTKLTSVGKVLDAAVLAGATNIESVEFTVANPDAAKLEALGNAAKDARARADVIAQALGVKVKNIHRVYDSGTIVAPKTRMTDGGAMMMMDAKVAASTPISQDDVAVTANISVEFAVE